VLTAAGDVTARFIESCTVTAGGNIASDSIINSTVNCNGEVTLSGKKGLLVGGKLIAGNRLVAKTIGSPMGTFTTIEVGNNPSALLQRSEMVDEMEKVTREYERVDQAVNLLSSQQKKGLLNDEKKQLLMKMLHAKVTYRERINELQLSMDELTQLITSNAGTVSASMIIHPGVRVTIGSAKMTISDPIQNSTLRNNGERIAIGSYR
jgi:hypothetical protein